MRGRMFFKNPNVRGCQKCQKGALGTFGTSGTPPVSVSEEMTPPARAYLREGNSIVAGIERATPNLLSLFIYGISIAGEKEPHLFQSGSYCKCSRIACVLAAMH
jgi:hypothetical protein